MPTLDDAIALAVQVHRGQKDKNGQPYILHPLRVMLRLEGEVDRTVGVLHDVVEDSTEVTFERLAEMGWGPEVIEPLKRVTRRPDETYEAFVERSATDPVSRRVKLADLEDNMDPRRLAQVGPREAERLARYVAAWHRLRR